jgi:TonB-linked SusC/RagA family outer membrane protein
MLITVTTKNYFFMLMKNYPNRQKKGKAQWLFLTAIALFCSLQLIAQPAPTISTTIHVTESNGEVIPGATVVVKGTNTGHITDLKGNCTLTAIPANAVLVISCLGMTEQEVSINGRTKIDIILIESSYALDEFVVVGYGIQRRKDITGAVAQVKGEVLNEFASFSAISALQGRVSGVQINPQSGQPGAGIQVRIRGANSIKGDNEPFWVINGFPGDINMINTSDIESIEILKDASATAIYGSRGANGVILVTTKGAKEGEIKVQYDGSIGVQSLAKQIEMLSGKEYMLYLNKKAAINNLPAVFNEIPDNPVNTNWQDEIFRNAVITGHALDISGGNNKMQGSFGLTYFNQDGIIIKSGYKRISMRTDLKYTISKYITASANIIYSRSDHKQMNSQGGSRGSSVIDAALVSSPLAAPRHDNGSWNDFHTQPVAGQNPVAYLHEISNDWYSNRLLTNAMLMIKPIEGLSIQLSANVGNNQSRQDHFKSLKYPNSQGEASISLGESLNFTSNNIVTYNKGFGKHHLSAMGGITYEESTSKPVGTGTGKGFLSDAIESYDLDAAEIKGLPTSGYSNWKIFSLLGRINYNYSDRYLLTVNFRSDGSSRYSKGNKWGYFPSSAFAWRASQEEFLKSVAWLSDLKLRIGYGKTGSTAISPYSTQNTLDAVNVVFDKSTIVGYAPRNTYLGGLKWETTTQSNIGLDLSLLNNRFRLTADYYHKKTTDLLNDVEMPRSSGYTTSLRNIGSIENRGFEFQLDSRIIDRALKWDAGVNFSFNRSKVLSLSEGKDIFGSTVSNTIISDQLNLIRVGQPMYIFYGYLEDGYDDKGQIRYKDLDGEDGISAADKTIIGNPNPDFLLNFNTSISYKRFSLSAFLQGSIGNDIYSLSMATVAYDYGYNANALREVTYNHWTPENPNAKYPNLLQTVNLKMSDRFVYDGSYMRLKNLELAYDIPCGKSRTFSAARIFVSGQNLFTITSFPFWDPDINARGGGSSLVQGVDSSNYPGARTYTLGCKLVF